MPDVTKLLSAIDAYESQSHGSDSDGGELSRQRALSLDAYSGRNIEPGPEGTSQVVDWTVFETIQWILPSITRIYASGDPVVEFEPMGPDDEEAAEQESEYLNYLVTQKNNWFLIVLTWAMDALLTKNAYCLVQMEEKLQPETETYEGQSEEQVALLLDDDVEVVGHEQKVDEENPVPVIDPQTGQPAVDEFGQPITQPRILYDIQIKRVKAKQKLQFTVLPPERCKVGEDTRDFTLDGCNYFEYYESTTISELRKEGHDIPDDIDDAPFNETEEDRARDDSLQNDFSDDLDLPDPSMRTVTKRRVWIRHDYDEDGIAELQEVLLVGKTVLEREEVSRIPVACIVPFINTHRHPGSSVADLVLDIQRVKTVLLRSGLNSLYLSTNPRHAVSKKVDLDDLLISKSGGAVRVDTEMADVQGHITPLPTEFVFPQAMEGLRHMDTVTESRAGVNRMFQGIDDSSLNDHDRIGQLSTMAAQRVEQIARIFANGFERLFSLAHELVIKSGHQKETIRLRGKWVDIDPSQWKTGRDMRVIAPFAAGNKDSLIKRLMIIAQLQEKAFMGGLPIVDADDAYNLALELAKAADLPATKFFTDPATVPPKEPPPDYNMIALQIEDKKADNQGRETELDADVDKYKADLDAEVKKYQTDTNTQLQIALAQLKEGQAVNIEKLRFKLKESPTDNKEDDSLNEIRESLSGALTKLTALQSELDAPREVVRDKSGKVTGVKIGNNVRKLRRDESGKVTGV